MASAAEQLAGNLSFSSFSKATELKQRIWFALLALMVYRLATYLPLPGIDPVALEQMFTQNQGGILGMLDLFNGGAIQRMSVIALGIMPYISASIIMQLAQSMSPKLKELKKMGEAGRRTLNQYTRYGTVLLCIVQSYAIATGLESGIAIEPGMFFRMTTVITLVGGTMFLVWLGEQITARGIGNGISLIIFAGIVAQLPSAIVSTLDMSAKGTLGGPLVIVALLVMVVAVIAGIVFVERAQRRLLIQYPKRQQANGMTQGEQSHMPLKLNTAGVIPPIFASSLLMMPMSLAGFASADSPDWVTTATALLGPGQPLYMLFYVVGIVFFCFFYTALVFNPEETADNLKKYGGFIPGIRPGKNTAKYLDYVLTRLTVVGAIYLCIICLLPEILRAQYAIPFYFGGTSLLIVVNVTMDTVGQIHSHLMAHQYEGLMKKSKLRGGKRRRR
ncbi:preprotein translocase subunit SecY [Pseudemcibacter aquimaris]|uniref:preprotein translocase subunit SecY n=1 Tax=Pseudemcibacter aquimaris TaxID=2857064 RepID=UPI0020122A00|nr:preprotein translocase subunit SecY [Pseudemcibacter aquimaris]MCC3860445.1 preprotein translocase subunit SecY [Pseudemcibacter aquimaris]WDU59271.1 preprotein translocase subunit SecY [Pseudemcibacter aquimaris]